MVGINERLVGKCGICGGEVVVPTAFHSVNQPVPACSSCGSTKDTTAHLPEVPMKPVNHKDDLPQVWQKG